MKTILKNRLPEAILIMMISIAFAQTLYTGFYISDGLASNFLLTGVLAALLLLILFRSGGSARNRIIGGIIILMIGAAGLVFLGASGISIQDAEGSNTSDYIFYVVTYIATLTVFLTTRHRYGVCALTAVGTVIIAVFAYLEFPVKLHMEFLFVIGCIMMLMWKNQHFDRRTGTDEKLVLRKFASVAVCCMLSIAMAGSLYALIFAPLSLPTHSIRIFTRDMTPEIVDKVGIADMYHIPDENAQSNDVDESIENEGQADQDNSGDPTQSEETDDMDQNMAKQDQENAVAINFKIISLVLLIILIILALIAGGGFAFLVRHNRLRREKMLQMEPREQVQKMYRYIFSRCRFLVKFHDSGRSPMEYAQILNEQLPKFVEKKVDFLQFADIFTRVYYGEQNVTADEYDRCLTAFDQFNICCREEKGWVKYLILFR